MKLIIFSFKVGIKKLIKSRIDFLSYQKLSNILPITITSDVFNNKKIS